MNDTLRDILDIYFNNTLKNVLKYKDKFYSGVYIPKENTIFFSAVYKDGDMGLILQASPSVTSQLKTVLTDTLRPYYPTLKEIKLSFSNEGFGIILIKDSLYYTLNLDLYVIIASYLTSVEDIENFCNIFPHWKNFGES